MSLRRFAQSNNAASASPRSPASVSSPASPVPSPGPSTPRNRPRPSLHQSPASTPSISSSIPFDWDAVRSFKPPPYASPLQSKSRRGRQSNSLDSGASTGTPVRRPVIRKKGIFEKWVLHLFFSAHCFIISRLSSIPSRVAFEVVVFPNNVPLPSPKTSAWMIGGTLHFIHLCVRVSQTSQVPDSDLAWADMYREDQGHSWFDWVCNLTSLACLFHLPMHLDRVDDISSRIGVFHEHHLSFYPYETLPSPS